MPYYPDLNLVYIHIPKTAGGAIENILLPWKAPGKKTLLRRTLAKLAVPQNALTAYIPGHSTAEWHRRVLGAAVFDRARRFAVVRNPYDRAISTYEFIRQNPRHHRHGKTKAQSFTEFLRGRSLSQVSFLAGRDGALMIDNLVKFETLPDGLDRLFGELGIAARLPVGGRRNSSVKQGQETYLTAENIGLINRSCEADFRLLGYAMLTAAR